MGAAMALAASASLTSESSRTVTFAEAVRTHQDEVYGAALRILGDRDAALDATNATFLKAYLGFARYDAARSLRAWLLTIAVREAITIGRARTRQRARHAPEEAAEAVADRDPTPAEAAERNEDRLRIRAAVARLPERYRVPLVLRYFNELSLDEIARVTGRPASTVGVQLMRARALLRDRLERS